MLDISRYYIDGEPDLFYISNEYGKHVADCDYGNDNAIPFIIANGEYHLGKWGYAHGDMSERGNLINYDDCVEGRVWVNEEIEGIECSVISFWWNDDINPIQVNKGVLDSMLNELSIDTSSLIVVVFNDGEYGKLCWYEEWEGLVDAADDSQKDLRAIHLMNSQDKLDVTKDFRDNRDKKIAEKIPAGMTVAQYRSMLYGESRVSRIVNEVINSYLKKELIF